MYANRTYTVVKPHMMGKVFMVRFADDIIVGFSDKQDAMRVMEVLPRRFGKFGLTLLDKSEDEKKDWSNNVLAQLKDKVSLEKDEFVILAGNNYCKYLLPSIINVCLPLEGKRQGERQPALHRLIALERETNLCKAALSGSISATKATTQDVSSVECAWMALAFDLPPAPEGLALAKFSLY